MATYGLDIYGKSLYGATPLGPFFNCDPMVAAQSDYGALQVTWTTPYQTSGTVPPAWSRQRLVRNSWGIPDTEDDGWVCLDQAAASTDPALGIGNTFLDNTVVPGRLYYYALFVASGITAYSATQTYQPGDLAVYSAVNYICLAPGTLNITPGTNAAIWATTPVTTPWYRCGSGTVGLAVADAGYRARLYDLIPRPYKVATVETTATSIPLNSDLWNFSSIFGFHLDVMKSENDALLRMNDIERCSDRQLGLIAQQMGVDSTLPAMPELRRSYVRDANAIQRQIGSAAGVAELVTDLTGWQTTASVGYNQLPTLDSASFASTAARPWDPATFYTAGTSPSLGDVVTYGGALYFAYGGTIAYAFYSGTVTATGGTVARIVDPIAGLSHGYVQLQGATVGSTLTVNVATTAGIVGPTYNIYICLVLDPSGGQVTASVAGTPVAGWSRDLYAPTRRMGSPVYLGTYTSPPSTIPIVLTVTGKQAVATGYSVFAAYGLLQSSTGSAPQNYGVAPSGAAGSSLYWTQTGLSAYRDTDSERNYLTDGQGIWSVQYADGAVNPRADNAISASTNGNFGIYPLAGAALATGSPGPGNALAYTTNSGATVGKVTVMTCGEVQAGAWSATTPYYAGQPVVVGGTVYTARNYTIGNPPASSPTKWVATSLQNTTLPERSLVQTQGIALKQTPAWSATTAYPKGSEVRRRETLYQAAQDVPPGVAPTGYTTDNPWWRWLGPTRRQYTLSAWHYRTATGSGQFVRPRLEWFDEFGTLLGSAHSTDGTQQVFDRFENEAAVYPAIVGTSPPSGWSTPAAWQQGTGAPWVTTQGTWATVDNMVAPSGWNSPPGSTTTTMQRNAGRVLWFDRQWLYGTSTNADTLYATFKSAPFDASYTMEHGIAFRYAYATGYWLASRDRLCWTSLTFSGATITAAANTVAATWAPLTDGTRMKVTTTATTVSVYAMTGAAPGTWVTLASVTSSQFNTQTGVGLMERNHL